MARSRRPKFKSLLGTDDLVTTLAATKGATLPIWVTEVGAHVNDTRAPGQTEAQQDDQVKWLVDTTSGLASHDRITRMSYYHVRQETDVNAPLPAVAGFPWDTALRTSCARRRPAWYTWCLAARQKDAACYDDSPSRGILELPSGSTCSTAAAGMTPRSMPKWWDASRWSAPARSAARRSPARRWSPPPTNGSRCTSAAATTASGTSAGTGRRGQGGAPSEA